ADLRRRAEEELDRRALPRALAATLRMENENALRESLDAAETAFRSAIETGVRERLRLPLSVPAPRGEAPASRLTYRDAARLYSSDKEAYKKRFGR
ncbi:MAG: hypothetical protein IJS53_02015, partial [Clostridia bacterium]|nr:hypothetical protein [Clostridia bacterium]